MNNRLKWLDGLKALACIGVFLHHFFLAFFPGIYMGKDAMAHMTGKLEYTIGQIPLSAFFCGEYMVGLFCLISGLVISYQIISMKERSSVSSFLLKRYPKLVLPLFVASLIVYVMLQFSLFTNVEVSSLTGSDWLGSYYQNKETFYDLLYSSFISVWFIMDNRFSNAFWMMKYLLIGSALSTLLAEMSWDKGKKMYVVYAVALLLSFQQNSMYSLFIFGSALSFYMCSEKKFQFPKPVSVFLLVFGIILGGYPTYATAEGFYEFFPKLPAIYNTHLFYHTLAAFFTVLSVYQLDLIKKGLESKPLLILAKNSYSFFLLHIPILFSFSTWLFRELFAFLGHYVVTAFIVLVISFLGILGCSILFHCFVEKNCYKFVDWAIKKLNAPL